MEETNYNFCSKNLQMKNQDIIKNTDIPVDFENNNALEYEKLKIETSNLQNENLFCESTFCRFFDHQNIKIILRNNILILIDKNTGVDSLPNYWTDLKCGTYLIFHDIFNIIESFDKSKADFFVHLLEFYNIKGINIINCNLDYRLIEVISKFKKLRMLKCRFNGSDIFPDNFEKINQVTELTLKLTNLNSPREIFEQIEKLKSLESLEIIGSGLNTHIGGLPNLENLVSLKLCLIYVDENILRDLSLLTNLQKLEIEYFSEDKLFMALDNLINLTELTLVPTAHADKYGRLEEFYVPFNNEHSYFSLPSKCKKIKKLYLSEVVELDPDSYKEISEMPELEELTIDFISNYHPDYIHRLLEISTLKVLSLRLYEGLNINWEGLKNLYMLEEFDISLDSLKNDFFKQVQNLENLKYLTVTVYGKFDLKLDLRWTLKSLEELSFKNFKITRLDIEIILRNSNLNKINLYDCTVDIKYLYEKISEYKLNITVSESNSGRC